MRKLLYSLLMVLSVLTLLRAVEVPETWSETALMQYEAALEAGKKVPYPWPLVAEDVFKKSAADASLDTDRLAELSSLTEAAAKPICECADALRLLQTIKINNPAAFKSDFALFKSNFPDSAYNVYMQPQKLLVKCPECNGSPVTLPPCRTCRNTRKCQACDGSGLEPIRASWDMRHASEASENGLGASNNLLGGGVSLGRGNPRKIKRSATPEEAQREPCAKCKGTGKCPVCMNPRNRRLCKGCSGMGVVPETTKLSVAIRNASRRGLAALRTVDKAHSSLWTVTQKVQVQLESLRSETKADVLSKALASLSQQYPEAAQKTEIDRLSFTFSETEAAQRKAVAENEAQAKAVKADIDGLDKELRAARRLPSLYRRREALADLKNAFPLATDRTALTAAVGDCETRIEESEELSRNALEELRALEDPELGIRRCEELLRHTDSESPYLNRIREQIADFEAMKAKQSRFQLIALGGGILVLIILAYAVFSGLRSAAERKKQRARNRRPIPNRFPTIRD